MRETDLMAILRGGGGLDRLERPPAGAPAGRAQRRGSSVHRWERAIVLSAGGTPMAVQNETRKAFHELLDLLREVDERWLGPEWLIQGSEDVAEGMRAAMHMLQGALVGHFEDDPEHPRFRRIVTPTRKFTGDNADAIYYDAAVRGDLRYRVRGRVDGAVYVSITVEAGAPAAGLGGRTAGVINDTGFDLRPDGSFEIFLGGPARPRNWIAL